MDAAATGIADSPAGVEPASYFPTTDLSPIGPIPTDSEVDALLSTTSGFPPGSCIGNDTLTSESKALNLRNRKGFCLVS